MRKTLEQRFWAKVQKTDGCWLWTGATTDGYGIINRDGICALAHRVSWELHNGPIPEGLCVLHECDNPPCIRPDHLFLGTKADNNADCHRKGRARGAPGEQQGSAKLTNEQIYNIRLRQSQLQHALADEFSVSVVQIRNILAGRSWAHLQEVA